MTAPRTARAPMVAVKDFILTFCVVEVDEMVGRGGCVCVCV